MFKGGFPTRIDKIIKLLIVAVLVSMMMIESASATGCVEVNGYVTDSISNLPISGVHARNASNITGANTFDTTGTDGFFNLTCYYPNSEGATTADSKIWLNASGYTEKVLAVNISTANNTYFGKAGISAAVLIPITPTISAGAASSIKRNSATFSWTVSTPTDNVTNLYVGSQILYKASGISNITGSWSNLSLSPSDTLTNLREGQTYTVYYLTYNRASGSIYDSASTTFTTLKSNMGAFLVEEDGATPQKPSSPLDVLKSTNKTPQQRNIIIGIIVAVVLIIAYFYFTADSGKGKGRK